MLDCPGDIMYDKRKHLIGSVRATDTNRMKLAAEWFYEKVFSDEAILPRKPAEREKLPSALRAARSLEQGTAMAWQTRDAIFLKQARLLAGYEDDYVYSGNVVRYYPTYQNLTDEELRGYFSWRTKLRQGNVQKAPLTFAFLYIYELLNQVGVDTPLEGFAKLTAFRDEYGALDDGILHYLKLWLRDYVIYYDLSPDLLTDSPQRKLDESLAILENIQEESDEAVLSALQPLPLKWLNRSKFYQTHRQEMDPVIARVLRRVSAHFDARCKRSFTQQYIGSQQKDLEWLFSAAVFCDPLKRKNYDYCLSSRCAYHCREGRWTVEQFYVNPSRCAKLDDLIKTIDRLLREHLDPKHPIKTQLDTKWILKIIQEEVQTLLAEKKAAEAKKITIDRSQLAKIRADAAVTQEKLMVDEETEDFDEAPPETAVPEASPAADLPPDCPLDPTEYRLLQCLLYGRDRSWVRTEGYLLSVLLDSINDKLYDIFLDSVLDEDGQPLPDYTDELKEMVKP